MRNSPNSNLSIIIYSYSFIASIITNPVIIGLDICGIDVNYLHTDYNGIAERLFKTIDVKNLDECWEVKNPKKRIQLPSYRSKFSDRRTDNVTLHKAIYTLCWGDVGTLSVTRSCGNPNCINPLHLVSSWNNKTAMRSMMYFDLDFNYKKLT